MLLEFGFFFGLSLFVCFELFGLRCFKGFFVFGQLFLLVFEGLFLLLKLLPLGVDFSLGLGEEAAGTGKQYECGSEENVSGSGSQDQTSDIQNLIGTNPPYKWWTSLAKTPMRGRKIENSGFSFFLL